MSVLGYDIVRPDGQKKKGEIVMRDFFEDLGKRIGETAETMTNMAGKLSRSSA